LETRFKNVLATRTGPDNQTWVYCIWCILCILYKYDILYILSNIDILCIFWLILLKIFVFISRSLLMFYIVRSAFVAYIIAWYQLRHTLLVYFKHYVLQALGNCLPKSGQLTCDLSFCCCLFCWTT
jgi:hypothetical protein